MPAARVGDGGQVRERHQRDAAGRLGGPGEQEGQRQNADRDGNVVTKKPSTNRQPLPSVMRPGPARASGAIVDGGGREDELQPHGDVDAGDHQGRHQEQAQPPRA